MKIEAWLTAEEHDVPEQYVTESEESDMMSSLDNEITYEEVPVKLLERKWLKKKELCESFSHILF